MYYVDPSGYWPWKSKDENYRHEAVVSTNANVQEIIERTTADIIKNHPDEIKGAIPFGDNFDKWFDNLKIGDLETLMGDSYHKGQNRTKEQSAKWQITDSLRGYGKMHEWLPVSQAVIAKKWGVTAEQIKAWTTPTKEVYFRNIKDKKGIVRNGFHGGQGSTSAHNQIIDMMKRCNSLEEYKAELNKWADDHVVRMITDNNGNVTRIEGRSALPEGLQVSSDTNIVRLADSNRTETINVSPKSNCHG